MLPQVKPQTGLLVLAVFQLREIDTEIELFELVLTTELDTIQSPGVVAKLLDYLPALASHM